MGALLVLVGVGIPMFSFLPGVLTPAGSFTARAVSLLVAVGFDVFSLSKNVSPVFQVGLCSAHGSAASFAPCFAGERSFSKLRLYNLLRERSESKKLTPRRTYLSDSWF